MKTNKILTRENESINEITGSVVKFYKGIKLEYPEVYYLDYEVDEDTGIINREKKVKYYTKSQIKRNNESIKECFLYCKRSRCT
jgi:hypothetical protein